MESTIGVEGKTLITENFLSTAAFAPNHAAEISPGGDRHFSRDLLHANQYFDLLVERKLGEIAAVLFFELGDVVNDFF